jgi:hypothetical protein
MHTTVSRHAAHLTVAVLLILLVGGCTGQDADQAATPQPATTTAAPTPTTVPPLTAKELAWLKALPKLDAKVAKALKGRLDLTIAKMRSLADAYRSCTRELLGASSQLRDGCRSGALGRTPPPVRVASPATESSCTSIRLALCNALFSANGSKTLKSQKALDRLERAAGREGGPSRLPPALASARKDVIGQAGQRVRNRHIGWRRAVVTVDRESFLSFTGADRPWAEWPVAELDAASYSSISRLRGHILIGHASVIARFTDS